MKSIFYSLWLQRPLGILKRISGSWGPNNSQILEITKWFTFQFPELNLINMIKRMKKKINLIRLKKNPETYHSESKSEINFISYYDGMSTGGRVANVQNYNIVVIEFEF